MDLKTFTFNTFTRSNYLFLILLFILIAITYGNSVNNAFLSDDLADIVNNPNIGNFSNIAAHPFGATRPILYWLTYNIGGLNPTLFRLTNIFFHLGTVFLIFLLFNLLYSRRLALIVSSIFAVHPAIAEPVIWISGGMYPQYTFFFLLSLIYYLLSKENKRNYYLSILFFLISSMSHPQMPLSLFLIFPLWELSFGNIKKYWKKTIPFLIISILFVLVTLSGLQERITTLQSVHYQEKGIDNIFLIIPVALTSYFELIIFPKTLTLYHSELAFGTLGYIIRTLITLVILAGVLICFKKNKYIFFWSSLFLVALAPTLTPFRLNWIVAERYLYLPILGILAIIGIVLDKLDKLFKVKFLTYTILLVILLLLSIRTIFRNIDWKNEDNLWIATGKTSPSSPNTHNNLGDVYGRWGDKQKALQEFQEAIRLKPNYGDAYHNLANTYVELGEIDKALENYHNAVKYNPNLWQSYQNIAAIYFRQKQYDKSLEYIQKAIQINPKNLNLVTNLGVVYLNMGDKPKALQVFNSILQIDPQNQLARQGAIEASK